MEAKFGSFSHFHPNANYASLTFIRINPSGKFSFGTKGVGFGKRSKNKRYKLSKGRSNILAELKLSPSTSKAGRNHKFF